MLARRMRNIRTVRKNCMTVVVNLYARTASRISIVVTHMSAAWIFLSSAIMERLFIDGAERSARAAVTGGTIVI
jgi:hypothetical protein